MVRVKRDGCLRECLLCVSLKVEEQGIAEQGSCCFRVWWLDGMIEMERERRNGSKKTGGKKEIFR